MQRDRLLDASPRQIREWRHDLVVFRDTYVSYLNDTLGTGQPGDGKRRSEVVRAAQAAEMVFARLGASYAFDPAPITQTPRIHGLVNTIFIHETPFGGVEGMFGNWPKSYEGIIHLVDSCLVKLEKLAEDVHRRRRNPFYWGDRALRALLGFPAYLISLIFGVPLSRIDESAWGTALRIATFVVDATLLVIALRALF